MQSKRRISGVFSPVMTPASPASPPAPQLPARPPPVTAASASSVVTSPASAPADALPRHNSTSRPPPTIRTVTPDPLPNGNPPPDPSGARHSHISTSASPRSIPGGEARRQGIVFNESFGGSLDSSTSSPPQPRSATRPRTQTMDGSTLLRQQSTTSSMDSRQRRASSRPTSPFVSPPPSIDSLPLPINTSDANKILILMKSLCGRMRGEIEYQTEQGGLWYSGVAWIDEDKGSLLLDPGRNGNFQIPLVEDLRGCRVLPNDGPEDSRRCLELLNQKTGVELLLRPAADQIDYWLASLLCWQQLRPTGIRTANGSRGSSPVLGSRRRGMSSAANPGHSRDGAIIKVGKVMLWDKGAATSPRAIVKRPSTRDLRSESPSWRKVSCILQDNGEFKLMTENDVVVLSVIALSQLSRCAIQQLDKSVLEEEFCIAIFPIYSANSKKLSIFRPIYLALDSRVLFEVWFVLLRAFTVPDLFGIESSTDQVVEIRDFRSDPDGQLFRIEKTIQARVTEAKLRRPMPGSELHDRHGKDRDPLVGNYYAELILDGEIRSRTATQMDTNNPFWRESAHFTELPATLPQMSVILKRVDGIPDSANSLTHSTHSPRYGPTSEVNFGFVEIPLEKMDRGKDQEQWLSILDDKKEVIGSLFVKVYHDELVVLSREDYKPLSDLLHKFEESLTSQIALAIPPALRRLAETFLNIFQVTGRATEWLRSLVEEEIDGLQSQNSMKKLRFSRRLKSNESTTSTNDRELLVRDMSKSLAGEANLLFRGNTLLTQSLEFHMRRLGKEYLEDMLCDKIAEINEANPDCEVDPSKCHNADELASHWTHLTQLTGEVWGCIAASAGRLPTELRQVLKYVRDVAEDRYGDFLRTVNYTSVSGFLFLRFICPAILNPKLFGLLRDNPRPRAQRTLTLIAKGLQALANLATFGKKESWMEPMNKFLTTHRQPFKALIDQLCSVSSEGALAMPPASYSTPNTILSRLGPVFKEGCPSLPYLIDQSRNFAVLINVWLEHHNRNTSNSHVYQNELAEFHSLCTSLQRRSEECHAKIEAYRASEGLSVATDDVTETETASIVDSINLSYGGPASSENDPYHAPGSSGSDAEGSDRNGDRNGNKRGGQRDESQGTLRLKRDKNRGFFSGLIGSKRDHGSKKDKGGSSLREKSRDKEDRGSRSILSTFSESGRSDHSSRH